MKIYKGVALLKGVISLVIVSQI